MFEFLCPGCLAAMKIALSAHVFPALTVEDTRAFQGLALATRARRGEVVGVARDVIGAGGEIEDLPAWSVYGRTPDGISRYPMAEAGPRWIGHARTAAAWARENTSIRQLVQTVGRDLGDGPLEVIHLRDAVILTRLRTPEDLAGPGSPPVVEAVRRSTVVVLPAGLPLNGQIHSLGGAAHVIGERLFQIARGLPLGPLREACRWARVVVLPPESGLRPSSRARRDVG